MPERAELEALVGAALEELRREPPELRPPDSAGRPGGLLLLPALPTVLVPDLHGRAAFLRAVLGWRPPGLGAAAGTGAALRDLIAAGRAQLLCLGDLVHTETGSASERWAEAAEEYASGWPESPAMDAEMGLCLEAVALVLFCKRAWPRYFHCLKGNHDNIANEEGRGDHPFYKFASEGAMTASWFERRFGERILRAYREFELALPILALGDVFVASHGEPAFALRREDLVEYRSRPEIVEALIWTANGEAEEGAVASTIEALRGAGSAALWFAGHRPVAGRYALRAGGRFVQFHNPQARRVAFLMPGRDPDPERDILDI